MLALPILLASATAAADVDRSITGDWRTTPATFEWSTWVRLGAGVGELPATTTARAVGEPMPRGEAGLTWQSGLGIDVSLPIGRRFRIGAWAEMQGWDAFGGFELVATRAPAGLDMFQYDGEGVWVLRGGGNRTHTTAAIAWGYRCPWKLWGPYDRTSRYQIGARLVMSATRSRSDPHDWSATFGIEFEPVGSIRYLFGIQDWYKH
jgi:hypothetical protein